MFCKWCGLESETTDLCSWCRRPFSSAAAPPAAAPVAEPEAAPAPEPRPASGTPDRGGARGFFADDLDDDLSPMPFAAPGPSIAHPPSARSAPPPAPLPRAAPDTSRPAPPTPARPTPPPVPRHPTAEGPSLAAIPIRRPAGPTPPPVIPVSRPAQPAPEQPVRPTAPPSAASAPGPIPLARAPLSAPRQAPPPRPLAEPAVEDPPVPELPSPPAAPHAGGRASAGGPPRMEPPRAEPPRVEPPPIRPGPVHLAGPVEAPDVDDLHLDLSPLAPSEDDEEPVTLIGSQARRIDLGGAPAPRHLTPQPTAVPKAGGRTWFCRWCGMESETSDRCSWCRRDLRALPATAPGKGPVVTSTRHGAPRRQGARPAARQTGGGVDGRAGVATPPPPVAVAPAPAAAARNHSGAPPLGSFQAQKSKYYGDKVLDPISGAHYDADTGESTDGAVLVLEEDTLDERATLMRQVCVYLAGLAAGVILLAVATHALPDWYLLFLALGNLAAGAAMPLLRVVPFAHEEMGDLAFALPIMLLLGPYVGAAAYIAVCVMKQDAHPAIVGIFLSYAAIRLPLDLARGLEPSQLFGSLLPFSPPGPNGDWTHHLVTQWLIFAGVIGWYIADMFRKLDE